MIKCFRFLGILWIIYKNRFLVKVGDCMSFINKLLEL